MRSTYKDTYKVGIVMPCYNLGPFIREAINSLTIQTFNNYVVYIVDDASTDTDTIKTLKQLEKELPDNFIVDYQKKNRGMNKVVNYAAKKLDTEYLLIFSPDDVLKADFLKETSSYLDAHSDVSAVCTWLEYFGQMKGYREYSKKLCSLPHMLIKNEFPGSSLMRKSLWDELGGYDTHPTQRLHQDYEFWIRSLKNGHQLSVIEKPLFLYRILSNSASHKADLERKKKWIDYFVNKHSDLYSTYAPEAIRGIWKNAATEIVRGQEMYKESVALSKKNSDLKKSVDRLERELASATAFKSHPVFRLARKVKRTLSVTFGR